MKPFRIGILGGMGPMAGVHLHRLIIEATTARTDQDHTQVVLFTDPKIPDRSASLAADGGREFLAAARRGIALLEQADVDVIAVACLTAHAKLAELAAAASVPVIDGVGATLNLLENLPTSGPICVLATNGSLESGLFHSRSQPPLRLTTPLPSDQPRVMRAIYLVKSGDPQAAVHELTTTLRGLANTTPTASFLLGCTELGLLYDELKNNGLRVIDPMHIMAAELARRAREFDFASKTH